MFLIYEQLLAFVNFTRKKMPQESANPDRMRRQPQQARAIERVNKILEAADKLFAEVGYEGATTNAIAARANTSIGSLYRFFPDKEAILKALAASYVEQLLEVFAQVHTPEAVDWPLEVYIDQVMNVFDKFIEVHPGYRVVFVKSVGASPELEGMDGNLCREIAAGLAEFYMLRVPDLQKEKSELIALVVVEVVRNLRRLSLTRDKQFQHQVAGEIKKILLAYLQPYLG